MRASESFQTAAAIKRLANKNRQQETTISMCMHMWFNESGKWLAHINQNCVE